MHDMDIMKKIQQATTESGRSTRLVKMVNHGEASKIEEREKTRKISRREISSEDSLDRRGREKSKRSQREKKNRRKRRYSSSDSYSSEDDDSSSGSSDDDTGSYSSTSDSTSSDERRKRKKSKNEKRRLAKRKRDHHREKHRRQHDKRSKHKSKWSSESSSDSASESTSFSSDSEEVNDQGDAHKPTKSSKVVKESLQSQGALKQYLPVLENARMANYASKNETKHIKGDLLHEEGEFSEENDALISRSGTQKSSNQDAGQDPTSDDILSRSAILNKRSPRTSPKPFAKSLSRENLRKSPKIDSANKSYSMQSMRSNSQNDRNCSNSTLMDPIHESSPVPASGRRQSFPESPTPDGASKRIRKGRGFSERYSYVRRYRTPSPEGSDPYSGRSFHDRYSQHGRYTHRPPQRNYGNHPRYNSRRSRSRSVSGGRRSRSPKAKQPTMSDRLRARLGPKVGDERGRFSERSKSLSPSMSDDDAGPRHSKARARSKSPSKCISGSP